MADRIEVAKAVEYVSLGSPPDTVVSSKIVAYVILAPGFDDSEPDRQVHVFAQKIRRS